MTDPAPPPAKVEAVARAIAPKAWSGHDSLPNRQRRTASQRHALAAIRAADAWDAEQREREELRIATMLDGRLPDTRPGTIACQITGALRGWED